MAKYQLVNPSIEGNMKTEFYGNDVEKVAKEIYETLSSNFSNPIPYFVFTFMDKENNLYHYEVKEKNENGESVEYVMKQYHVTPENEEKFTQRQNGGKRKRYYKIDDSSTSSSSDSDKAYKVYINPYQKYFDYPINYFSYDPGMYKYNSMYIPMFSYPNYQPYIEIITKDIYM